LVIENPPIDDERLADYRVVSEPRLAREQGVFIAEGRTVVERLLTRSPLVTRSVLVTPAALTAIEPALTDRPDIPVLVVPQAAMNQIAGFNIHRGCLAAGERPSPRNWRDVVGTAKRFVILEHVGDADNVGAIFRTAAAFGVDAVLVGPACADPLYRKAIRTSMGAALTLSFAMASPWPDALHELAGLGWDVVALTPAEDVMSLREFAAAAIGTPVALVVGHEGEGLTAETLAACTHRVRIPVRAEVDSLNVAAATAVALYEVCREREPV
jgi:tRNA G18 (ribose-2'-O)-methylase SpoU